MEELLSRVDMHITMFAQDGYVYARNFHDISTKWVTLKIVGLIVSQSWKQHRDFHVNQRFVPLLQKLI